MYFHSEDIINFGQNWSIPIGKVSSWWNFNQNRKSRKVQPKYFDASFSIQNVSCSLTKLKFKKWNSNERFHSWNVSLRILSRASNRLYYWCQYFAHWFDSGLADYNYLRKNSLFKGRNSLRMSEFRKTFVQISIFRLLSPHIQNTFEYILTKFQTYTTKRTAVMADLTNI